MNEHEVYPNPPVVLVALEIRHPSTEALTPSQVRAIKEDLHKHVPITKNASAVSTIMVPDGQGSTKVEHYPRLVDRANTLAVSVRQEALVVESSVYPGWERFKVVVADAILARLSQAPIDGVERVGIRYINEVRVPAASAEVDWTEWVQPQLSGPRTEVDPLPLTRWQGVGLYGQQPGRMVIFRYGPVEGGVGLDPRFDLRRRKPSTSGPFFLMDVDSFWTPSDGIPEADPQRLKVICEEIHEPVSTIFENSITDRLREVFREDA